MFMHIKKKYFGDVSVLCTFWRQKSTSGCLQSYCVIGLLQASMYNKVINIVQV